MLWVQKRGVCNLTFLIQCEKLRNGPLTFCGGSGRTPYDFAEMARRWDVIHLLDPAPWPNLDPHISTDSFLNGRFMWSS